MWFIPTVTQLAPLSTMRTELLEKFPKVAVGGAGEGVGVNSENLTMHEILNQKT